ncbi:uncharacterized protein [Clytia hemisphaerica]|uniref:Uncharacterized protein n=1 Tax=Clytia hemisphaerica TaxID=252671 RepID=A0A7M5X301_9CNID|eukprot:TCONS_00003910-protein
MRLYSIPLLLLVFWSSAILAADPIHLENVECAPYIDHVATDPNLYRYEPYFVKMHRCHGKHPVPNPKNEKCVPKMQNGKDNVEIIVLTKLGNVHFLNITNHTDCEQRCVISQEDCTPYEQFKSSTCGCSCNYSPSTGPKNCYAPFIWQQSACNCICPKDEHSQVCAKRKVFSKEECGCTCKAKFYARCAKRKQVVDEGTCECVDPEVLVGKSRSGCDGGVNGAMLAVVIIVEAFVIVFCYYFFYRYCYKHNFLGRKKEKNVSSGYYHNGDIPNDTAARTYESTHDEREKLTENTRKPDKELIRQEERERVRLNGLSDKERIRIEEEEESDQYAGYYPEEEKSRYPNHNGDMYYNDIMEVDGPPSSHGGPPSLDNHNLNIPPDYSDAISDFSEDGYGSVTQV